MISRGGTKERNGISRDNEHERGKKERERERAVRGKVGGEKEEGRRKGMAEEM